MIRKPAVAGAFYPADPEDLRAMIARFLAEAPGAGLPPPRAVVAPHAGYVYSGPVAGHAFQALAPRAGSDPVVWLLGPAHYLAFEGISTGPFTTWATPLGEVPVAADRLARLLAVGPPFTDLAEPHLPEHSLEVELPFLQAVLGRFSLVPLLFGIVDPLAAAPAILEAIEPGDLVVVSTDLSHYHPDDAARRIDAQTLDRALHLDAEGVLEAEACGRHPWAALTWIARARGWRPRLLAYATSGDTSGDRRRVVGYAALRYDAP